MMAVSTLSPVELEILDAAITGKPKSFQSGDKDFDSPSNWKKWGPERTVQAQVIADLLSGDGKTSSTSIRRLHIKGAHITGSLNLEAKTLRCPLILEDCYLDSDIILNEATASSVALSGSHVPKVYAKQLVTRGDLLLNKDLSASRGIDLTTAHIGGALDCSGGHFVSSDSSYGSSGSEPAINADGLTVDGDMSLASGFAAIGEVRLVDATIKGQLDCSNGHFVGSKGGVAINADDLAVDGCMALANGFWATGEVRLPRAKIKGQLDCSNGHFVNLNRPAITADLLTVDGAMFLANGFRATGEVRLPRAQIKGELVCRDGHFAGGNVLFPKASHRALTADGLVVDGDMFCDQDPSAKNPSEKGFEAVGAVRLPGAHIKGDFDCRGGHFSSAGGKDIYDRYALYADGLTVDSDIWFADEFSATGEVRLLDAQIRGKLDCSGGRFSNSDDPTALNLKRTTVSGPLVMEPAELKGILDLTDCKTSKYCDADDKTSWPQTFRIEGFIYDDIKDTPVEDRLAWLLRNVDDQNTARYFPQIYEQLAAIYHRNGNDRGARRVLIENQRQRTAQGNFGSKVWGCLLDCMVGYGYRTWLALVWLLGLLALGSDLFGVVFRGDMVSTKTPPPPFHPFIYTLDLLLPVASLNERDSWVAQSWAQGWSVFFILMGWILASAIVLGLTGLLRRDIK